MIVPRLYYVPESELSDDAGGASASSFTTLKDLSYKMKPMIEKVPFQWAQALYFTAGLMSMFACRHRLILLYYHLNLLCSTLSLNYY